MASPSERILDPVIEWQSFLGKGLGEKALPQAMLEFQLAQCFAGNHSGSEFLSTTAVAHPVHSQHPTGTRSSSPCPLALTSILPPPPESDASRRVEHPIPTSRRCAFL
jgi:hypothetical protein